jgi:hypothetical protein
MSQEEKSNQEEEGNDDIFGDEDETEKAKSADGDDSEDASLTDDALTEYNKRVGKNYKSWDDVANREKEADKAFAKGEHKKVEVKSEAKSSINDEVVEELLLSKHPEAEHILDELKETAKLKGVSVLKLFRESKYFQGEAKAIADAKKSEEEQKSKIKMPSNGAAPKKTDVSSVKAEEVASLKPSEKMEWIKAQAEKERNNDE